ncbi:A disintegrin and metalloproteinase with thrombospondin motifs 19 isoform X3 [Hemicordylus capensis]|uniref:A disintegrin and metalloproteinase with thrombospondin motifs 19 isoform X3 n=1 Tax=Hemicordylus capensis TaxID=884348 RepID=UPI0023026C1F|nr:A disintegrin and metalloproteinase with thrombospondin motifs 19 isoform X3 [Hemicordylus capensis]
MEKKRRMRLSHFCCLAYQLCFLSNGITAGLQPLGDTEEWEIIYPALWSRGQQEPTGGSGAGGSCSTDGNCGNSNSNISATSVSMQALGSSREVRSVSSSSDRQLQPGGETSEDEGSEDEYESQEFYHWSPFPQGSNATSQLPPPPPLLPSSSEDGGEVLLRIPAFAQELYLLLKRDSRFLAPGFAVEERLLSEKRTLPNSSQTQMERSCYYSGSVLHYPGSFASFSTCGGLMGFLQMNEDFIFIEPLNHTLTVTGHAHRVYRRKRSTHERATEKPTSHSQYCGVVTEKRRSKGQKGAEGGRGKRYSYKLPQEYNVETVVIADPAMVLYHGADAARRFILTILNMVFNLFQHKSLGVQVNLRVTKLVLLHETPADMYIGHHGEKMLESFCKWQHEEFGKKNDIHLEMSTSWGEDVSPVDAAILITRKDFCVHKDEPCDTVGIAYLNGMCSEKRKCIIAEDNGLNLAFTIAHEMGHNMGINHDNDHPSCADGLHIMSGEWIKGQNLGDVSWSRCSREDLERFLRSKASNCLLQTNPQSLNSVIIPSKLPGMTYTADEQCQILFGPTASFCQEMQHVICTGLWCKVEGEKECKTKLDPPMDGTDCDTGKWCKAGECTSKTSFAGHMEGEWSTWSTCSRTCNTGVSNRQRRCSGSVHEGGECHGSRIQYKICENPSCPPGVPAFRDWQCQVFSVRPSYQKHVHQWQAVIDDEKPCALLCSLNGKDQPVLITEKVMDGTSCGHQELDICANGRCQKFGCDGILGSLAWEDHCGVCNGDGKSCRVVKGDFNHTRGAGYVEALVIPAGARRIKVVEEKPAHSYLGERKTTVSCTKIMNKNISFVDNKKCKYLTKPEPQIRKCNEQPCQTRWMMTEWTLCSRTCGKGTQNRQVACTQQLRNGTLIRARERDCLGPKPTSAQRCEGQDCMTVWEAGVWSECSVKCGKGVRHRTVRCTNPRKKCVLSTRPREAEDCEDYSKCYVWRMGDWSKCSITCGKGMQSRVIQCMHKITGRHGNECFSSEKPAAYRPCHLHPCNEKINVNTITSPRLAALTFKCLGDQWPVYCRVIREKNLCQDMRWYQRCCETCRDFYAQKMQQKS